MADTSTDNEQEIRERAYALWVEAGCPDGQNEAFWHQAVEELGDDTATPAPAAPAAPMPKA